MYTHPCLWPVEQQRRGRRARIRRSLPLGNGRRPAASSYTTRRCARRAAWLDGPSPRTAWHAASCDAPTTAAASAAFLPSCAPWARTGAHGDAIHRRLGGRCRRCWTLRLASCRPLVIRRADPLLGWSPFSRHAPYSPVPREEGASQEHRLTKEGPSRVLRVLRVLRAHVVRHRWIDARRTYGRGTPEDDRATGTLEQGAVRSLTAVRSSPSHQTGDPLFVHDSGPF